MLTLIVIVFTYVAVSVVGTMMVPYYEQVRTLHSVRAGAGTIGAASGRKCTSLTSLLTFPLKGVLGRMLTRPSRQRFKRSASRTSSGSSRLERSSPCAPGRRLRRYLDHASLLLSPPLSSYCVASLVGSMFPLPRVLLTMAADGMIFRSWGEVSPITGTSLRSTFVAWVMSSSMALLFNLEQLIDMMSIGTLTAYIVVAVSVVQIR